LDGSFCSNHHCTLIQLNAQTAHANERQQSRGGYGNERSYGRQHYQQQPPQSGRPYDSNSELDEYVSALPSTQLHQQPAPMRARKPFRTVSSNGVLGQSNDGAKPSAAFAQSEIGALFKEHFPAASSSSLSSHGGQYGRTSADMKQSSSRGGGGSLLTASGTAKPRTSSAAHLQASSLYSHEDFLAVQAAAFAAIGPGSKANGRKGPAVRHESDSTKYKL